MKRIAIASNRQEPVGSAFCFMQNNINEAYSSAIIKCGGIPLVIPYCEPTFTDNMLEGFDGLMLIGGGDISPIMYGEENRNSKNTNEELDRFHMALVTSARKKGIPILGICRGLQVLNIAYGGTLYQDIEKEKEHSINHRRIESPYEATHEVELVEGTKLYSILKKKHIGVNSLHHQGVNTLGFGLKAAAYAPDGLIEAFEGENVFAVQWHPEAIYEMMEPIFRGFVEDVCSNKAKLLGL